MTRTPQFYLIFPPFFSLLGSLSNTDILSWIPMNPGFECRGTAVPSFTTRTLYQPPIFLIGDTCEYTNIYIRYSLSNSFKTNMLYISKINVSIYIHCSICICSVFDHFGYRAPDLNAWNHLTWYSEDWTLQWLQALRVEMNPHHIRGHEFCHREEDQSTLAITRAIMDRVSATIATQAVATSTTSSAPGTSTAPTPSELAASGKNIPSSYQFITSDSDDNSNGIPQILSEDEATPPTSSDHPPVPKVTLKRKKKAKKAKGEGEDKATAKSPKMKKRKKADAAKSSAKAGKLIVKLPLSQQPFIQQLQTLAAKQSEQSTTSETSRRADDSSSDTQGDGDSTQPSSSGNKTA